MTQTTENPIQPRKTAVESLEPLILMSAGGCDSLSEGTENNDFLFGATASAVTDGLGGHDVLFGTADGVVLIGGDGDDSFFTLRDDIVVDGGAGNDIAYFWGTNRDDVQVELTSDGQIKITAASSSAKFSSVETFQFKDARLTVDELLPSREYRSIDGTGNNLQDYDRGSTDEQLIRLADVEYADGVSAPAGEDRPGARVVSNEVATQVTTDPNRRHLTDATWLWGQFLDHDISISEGAQPYESFYIPVPADDALFDPYGTGEVEIPLSRTVFDPETGDSVANPREQINQVTTWIDGSMIYGSDEARNTELRSFEGGRLRMSDGELMIFNDAGLHNQDGGFLPAEEQFLAGDVRANENAALTAMHTVWQREHNRIADEISLADSTLTDEAIYQQSREIVIAEIQAISYNEFLPALLGAGALDEYSGYDALVDPTIANEFSTAAYRFGHTMLSSELQRLKNDGSQIEAGNLDLMDAFFAPDEITEHGIDSLLLGVTQQVANEVDTMIVDDVRNALFGPPGAGGMDLASLNIQRGRDHGLADYNDVRVAIGLDAVTTFADITADVDLQHKLEILYGTVDKIDLWVGGLAEDHIEGSSMGETFQTILADQFTRLRDGDRFWYENLFDGEPLELIESTTLADVIERNTTVEGLQDNVFMLSPVA